MARRFWGSGDPVGRRIEVDLGGGQRTETMIVGLVRDARIFASSTEPQAELYLPYAQAASPGVYLVLDAPGDPLKMTATAKQVLRSVAPDLVFADIRTMDQILSDAIAEPRFQALLLGLLAGLAFVLAMIGIYGVMSYSAGLRAHEIGVRMALGARRSSVLAMILREAGALIAFGVASGLLGAFALTRLLKSMLYGTSPTDPAAFAGAVVVLALVGAAACAIPAWRATRIDPLAVLRSE
jgi:putative ABC transport system permease protein